MSLTLSIPPAIVQTAKEYAAEKGTSISELVREYFSNISKSRNNTKKDHSAKFFEIADRINVRSDENTSYTKEMIHSL